MPRLPVLVVAFWAWNGVAAAQPPPSPPDESLEGPSDAEPATEESEPDGEEPAEEAPRDRVPDWTLPSPPSDAVEASVEDAHDHEDEEDRGEPTGGEPTRTTSGEAPIRYFLEGVEVHGNTTTRDYVVRRFVPIDQGEVLDVDDPAIEAIRWRLLGTGFFDDVRLRLRRGARHGWVILIIEVEERNTLVIQQLALGLSQGVRRTADTSDDLLPYVGLTVAETNLLGLGMQLQLSTLASKRQQGVRGRFTDPVFLGSNYLFSASAFWNNGQEFFGEDPLVAVECPMLVPGEECPPEVEARNAVVFYDRYGLSVGTGHDIGAWGRYTIDWQPEIVDVRIRPDAASETRGDDVEPIEFSVFDGVSFLSALQLRILVDRRNNPALPQRGVLVRFGADLAGRFIGSDYEFLRMQMLARWWIRMPWADHHLRLGAFGGAIFGDAPFFYKFFVADLTDLIPSRVLEMNIDGRQAPNLLSTSIAEMRSEELAARVDVEYGIPLYTGGGGIREIHAYVGAGLYALADRDDLRVSISGFEGFSRVPVDFTFDLGVRADTSVGVFQVGFSSLLGFADPFSQ